MQDAGQEISVSDLAKTRPVPGLRRRTLSEETGHGGRSINALAAALVIGAVMLPSLLLGGKLGEVRPVAAKSATEAKLTAPRPPEIDALRAMERVAQAELPRPLVLALIAPSPLQNLQIAGHEESIAGEPTQIVSDQGRFPPAAKPNLASKIHASSKSRAPAGTKTLAATAQQLSGASNSQRLTARPASDRRRGFVVRSVNHLSREQIARALFDTAERAGFVEGGEYQAFQACVLEKIPREGAEAELFWNLVRRCAR